MLAAASRCPVFVPLQQAHPTLKGSGAADTPNRFHFFVIVDCNGGWVFVWNALSGSLASLVEEKVENYSKC